MVFQQPQDGLDSPPLIMPEESMEKETLEWRLAKWMEDEKVAR